MGCSSVNKLHASYFNMLIIKLTGSNKNEHIQYLEANHRDICKFTSMNDSNYVRVKNALGTAVESLLENGVISELI